MQTDPRIKNQLGEKPQTPINCLFQFFHSINNALSKYWRINLYLRFLFASTRLACSDAVRKRQLSNLNFFHNFLVVLKGRTTEGDPQSRFLGGRRAEVV